MSTREFAIMAGLVSLSGCRDVSEAEKQTVRARGPAVTMEVMGGMEKAFKKGLDADAVEVRDWPSVMQKGEGRDR